MKTLVVSMFGGPGTGKSTSAAYVYACLKERGLVVELVQEWVKAWAYEQRPITAQDQLYIMAKQIRQESRLLGKVGIIVTDGPVWLGAYYTKDTAYAHPLFLLIGEYEKALRSEGHQVYPIWLKRSKPYQPIGRYQTEEQAIDIDGEMSAFFAEQRQPLSFRLCGTSRPHLDIVVSDIYRAWRAL